MLDKSLSEDKTDFEDDRCPGCGKALEEWSTAAGFHYMTDTFCCKGCATETGCICGNNLITEAVSEPGVKIMTEGSLIKDRRRKQTKLKGHAERRTTKKSNPN